MSFCIVRLQIDLSHGDELVDVIGPFQAKDRAERIASDLDRKRDDAETFEVHELLPPPTEGGTTA